MKVHCPECKGTFRVDGAESGTTFHCYFCKAAFSFRDKETIVLSASPQTQVKIEGDESGPPPVAIPVSPQKGEPPHRPLRSETPPEFTDLRPGDVVNDAYRLEEVIGWGGMSVVFRATQLSLP